LDALSQSSTDTMVALQKKQSLLFIRCWLMQALQQGGDEHGPVCPYATTPPPAPYKSMGPTYLQDLWPQGWNTAEMGWA
jgi:hypothetical protein